MNTLTREERILICIYGENMNLSDTISALKDMRGYLEPDEDDLRKLTDSALTKLRRMTDRDFAALDLFAVFDS